MVFTLASLGLFSFEAAPSLFLFFHFLCPDCDVLLTACFFANSQYSISSILLGSAKTGPAATSLSDPKPATGLAFQF